MNVLPGADLDREAQARALRDGAGAHLLEHASVLAVRGRDRITWLNGVVTQDVRALRPGAGVRAVAVTVKGKILADLFVLARADELLLVLDRTRRDELAAHFEKYIIMEDVELAPLAGRVLTVQGPRAAHVASALGEHFTADRLGRGGVDLVVAADAVSDVRARTEALVREGSLVVVGPEAWEVARLEAGVPELGVDFDGSNYVQEAALTARAVSFHKGCYIGQEVVCRLEMRGHVQKLLTGLLLEGPPPPRGTEVLADGRLVGTITSAAPSVSRPGHAVALAMVKYAVVEAKTPVTVLGVTAAPSLPPLP